MTDLREQLETMDGHAALLLQQNESLEQDLLAARTVQRFMLPPEMQSTPHYEIAQLYQPLRHIGGDFVDTLVRPDHSVVALIADITGHGVAAAMIFAMLKLAFTRHAPGAKGPAELLSLIERDLAGNLPGGKFVTALAVVADASGAVFSSAGHPLPILMRAGAAQQCACASGFPLLIAPETPHTEEARVELQPRDRLMLLTDGTLEAAGADDQRNSAEALRGALHQHAQLDGLSFLQAVYESLFFGELVFHDDVTLLSLMRR